MKGIIQRVKIQGFRSIENRDLECAQCNVLTGTNDSGKSNVLRALNLFFNQNTDFLKPLKFSEDYNKVSLARAIRSSKMKQQIRIRIYLNVPNSYSSLITEPEVYVERGFDRYGQMSEKFSNDAKKAQIKRLLNRIQYIYIPALKGENVLQYMLGLIGSFELIDEEDIASLNNSITENTKDLVSILKNSKVPISSTFGFPLMLEDFWSRLSVNTNYEFLTQIDQKIRSKIEKNNRPLSPSLFQIPLSSRGEGIKSMYIPPLLQWLDKNSTKLYIWGIDEPENSLEFSQSERLSKLYFGDYSRKNQIFLTSHSLAFINPEEDVHEYPKRFRCIKDELGSTRFIPFDDLLKKSNEVELFHDLGVLEAQKTLIDEYRKLKQENLTQKTEVEGLYASISRNTKPILLTEGKTDVILITEAWKKLYPNNECPFDVISSGVDVDPDSRAGSARQVQQTLAFIANLGVSKPIIGLFDNDREGNEQFKGLHNTAFEVWSISNPIRKHLNSDISIAGMLLPPPDNRGGFVVENNAHHRYLEIEHYFSDSLLEQYNLKGEPIVEGATVFEIIGTSTTKKRFAKAAPSFGSSEFENFRILFDSVNELI